jgi:REP element-mobilizing transposase RayT
MGHTYANLLVHVIFSTKGRAPLIRPEWRQRLHEYLAGVARNEFGSALRIGSTENHLHGLLSLNSDVSTAEAIRKWKSLSSKWVHETFPGESIFAWQTGYAAFSVSKSNAEAVARYIDQQEDHHRTTTFEEEFIAFLQRHGIDYDPKYVFD